jgi:peptide/nickel transport system substrate-binding protein
MQVGMRLDEGAVRAFRAPRLPFASAKRLAGAIAAAIVLCTAIGASGCGGGLGTAASSSTGGTLTIADGDFPPTFDPAMGLNEDNAYYAMTYDPLIVHTAAGKFEPGLALGWQYGLHNESFSMKLRPNVVFSDGSKLDAEAVKIWIEHVRTLPGGPGAGYLGSLKSVDVTGPLSLTLHFSKPTPLLEFMLSQELSIGQVGSPKAVKAGTLKTDPDGAGPYVLDQAETVARDHYTFVPNPHYWNKSAIHWKKIVLKTITNSNAALEALKTNQVQVVENQAAESIGQAKSAGLKFVAPTTLLMGLQFSDLKGELLKPLGNVRVRQAINYAINRAEVGKLVGLGYGEVIDQMAANGDDDFVPALQSRYPYDPAKAKQLLAEAGYPHGFSMPVLSTAIVGLNVLTEAVAGQLAKVGIKVEPDIKTNVAEYTEKLATKEYPVAALGWGRLPAVTNYQVLWGPNATAQNPFDHTSPKLEHIYQELLAAPADEAEVLNHEMQRFLVDEAWFAPVYATPLVVLYRSSVAGVNASAQRDVTYPSEYRPAG